MKTYVVIVEPLRYQAVQRWFSRHGVLLPSARAFVLPDSGLPQNTRASVYGPSRGERHVEEAAAVMRALRSPTAFRGRAQSRDELIESCPALNRVRSGDFLVVPHMPERSCLTIHRVGSPALVEGSTATSALPIGFTVDQSWGLDGRLTPDLEAVAEIWEAFPKLKGPCTHAPSLRSLVAVAIEGQAPDWERSERRPGVGGAPAFQTA